MPENTKVLPPIFSDVPFKKIKIPYELYSHLESEYQTMEFEKVDNEVEWDPVVNEYTNGGISVKGSVNPYTLKTEITNELYNHCYDVITPIAEDWCGQDLEISWAYGVRNYIRNSVLHLHRDLIETHIISCIIFVDQKSNKNWPLDFFDHDHKHHKVYFEPGEMLLYESLCLHGRLEPFDGKYYRNMYFHWRPENWDYEKIIDLKTSFKSPVEFKNYYAREIVEDRKSRIVPRTR